jgi:hypothetical protein
LVLIFLNCFLDLELDVPPAAEITASLAETRIKKILFGGDIFFATIINRFVILPFQINLQNLTRTFSTTHPGPGRQLCLLAGLEL